MVLSGEHAGGSWSLVLRSDLCFLLFVCLFRNQASTSYLYVFSYLIYNIFSATVSLKVIALAITKGFEYTEQTRRLHYCGK